MNQRRGYCLSAAIIALDLLLTPFGWLAAVASLVWAGGLGEWATRKKLGAVPCTGGVSRSQRRLEACYRRVMAKAGEKLPPFCGEVEIYSLPGQQVNGAAFGRSIGITEGALQLDDHTVEAIIAHELGHIAHGDAVLNMVLTANIFSLAGLLVFWQLALGTFWLIVLAVALCCGVRFGYVSWMLTDRLSGLLQRVCEGFRSVCVALVQILARAAGRKGELQADAFAVELGYGFALCRFLERFADQPQPGRTSLMCSTAPTPTVPCGRTISAVGCSRTPRPSDEERYSPSAARCSERAVFLYAQRSRHLYRTVPVLSRL